jgi:hypothetical protein
MRSAVGTTFGERRRTLRPDFRLRFAGIVLAFASSAAGAGAQKNLYVDVNHARAELFGECSSPHRPCKRITDALARARAIRAEQRTEPGYSDETVTRIVIHIAAGTYVGTVGDNPGASKEQLPLRVDAPAVTLQGSTVLATDADDWPVAQAMYESQTEIKADPPLAETGFSGVPFQSLLIVTRTTDAHGTVRAGHRAVLSGLVLSAGSGSAAYFSGVRDASMVGNVVRGGTLGIVGDRSTIDVGHNIVAANGCGLCGHQGTPADPAVWDIHDNRMVANSNGAVLILADITFVPPLLFGISAYSGITFDDELLEPVSEPPRGVVRIARNDLSNNGNAFFFGFGIRLAAVRNDDLQMAVSPGSLELKIERNRIVGNRVGVWTDGGFPYRTLGGVADDRTFGMHLAATFEGNEISGNSDARSLVTFTRNNAAVRPNQLDPNRCSGSGTPCPASWKYLRSSRYDITDLTGDLDDGSGRLPLSTVDHPANDLFDGGELHNVLTYNGVEVPPTDGSNCLFPRFGPSGTTPLPGCVMP